MDGRGSIYVDALDILAEDHASSAALKLFRTLLNLVKEGKRESLSVLAVQHFSAI